MATKINTPPNKAWAQVTDDALQCTSDSTTMVRTYKLPTSCCTNILNQIKPGYSLELVEGWIAAAAGTLDVGVIGSKFTPATDETWGLNRYQLQQIEAGEYMILKCWFQYTGIDIDTLPEDWSKETTISENVTWQTYSVSPYIYCNEQSHTDSKVTKAGQATAASEDQFKSKQKHINGAITNPPSQSDNQVYRWMDASGQTYELTNAEKQIFDKVVAGVNPVFHKPIISKTVLWESNQKLNIPSANQKIDTIQTPDAEILSKVPWDYSWIYQGRTMTTTERTYFTPEHDEGVTIYQVTYTDVWEGAREPDADFYGDNAWEFHEGPTGGN